MKNPSTHIVKSTAYKLILLSICCIFISSFLSISTAQAQLQGTYTIGSTDGDYASFTEAAQALEAHGVAGPVTFKVRPGAYQEQLQIHSYAGSSCENPVIFESESGSNDDVFLDNPPPGFPVHLNGAHGITIRNLSISGGETRIEGGSDCINLEENILRNTVSIQPGSEGIKLEKNSITGDIRASSGPGALSNNHHTYIENILSGGIYKDKSGDFIPSAPDFDEGLEITGNTLHDRLVLAAQKGIIVNHNTIDINHRITSGAVQLTNCWYGKEMMGNDINVTGVSSGLASGIEAVSGIPARVSENKIQLQSGPAIEDPSSSEGYSYDYGGGTGMLLSGGKTTNDEVLIANNLIHVSGWDRRRAILAMDGIRLKEGYSATETIKVYHNTISISGFNQEEIYAFKAAPLPENSLYILNNEFLISASYDSPSPAFYTMQIDDHASIAVVDYNIHAGPGPDMSIGENSNPEDGKGIYLEAVPEDLYGQPRADPPFIGAVEGEAPDDPTDPTDPTEPGEPLSGTFTIGGEAPDFNSFTAALEALESRGKTAGELIFKIRPGTYTEQLVIQQAQDVIFEGETADSTDVVLQFFGAPVVRISGGNVTLRHLTISGTGSEVIRIGSGIMDATLEGNILRGIGDAVVLSEAVTNLRIDNNFIQGGENGVLINASRSAGLNSQNVHHLIRNNILKGGTEAIRVSFGNFQYGYGLKGLEISGNVLEGQRLGGIYLFGQDGAVIEHNRIKVAVVGTEFDYGWGIRMERGFFDNRINHNEIVLSGGGPLRTAIHVWGESNPAEIMHNRILLPEGGTGIGLDVFGADSYRNETPLLVANNIISIKAHNQSSGISVGDYGGETHYFFNSIHLYGEAPESISMDLGRFGGAARLANNIFSNQAGGQAIHLIEGAEGLPDWTDYNAYYSTADTIRIGEHDLFVNPQFEATEVLIPTNMALAGAGTWLEAIPLDFFGQQRNNPPTIGAVEIEVDDPEIPLALTPIVECLVTNPDGSLTATFGYHNPADESVQLAVGSQNFLNLLEYAGQPESFAPGRHQSVFHVVFEASESLSWTLGDTTVTVGSSVPVCDSPIQPVEPLISCTSEISRTLSLATLGYHNPNEAPVAIAAGRLNRMFGPRDLGQPSVFEAGHHPEAFAASYSGALMWTLAGQHTIVNRDTPACSPALQAVLPILECVSDNGDGTYTAHFGYHNPNPLAVSAGFRVHNLLLPGFQEADELPVSFEPGRHEWAFSIPFRGQRLEWRLMGQSVTATRSATMACSDVNARVAGMEDMSLEENPAALVVYPNFFSRDITIRLQEGAYEQATFRVYSITGGMVAEATSEGQGADPHILNLHFLKQGAYILEVHTEKLRKSFRIFKQ